MANLNTTESREIDMTRKITAQQVKPGMKIKYEQHGWERAAEVYEIDNADNPREDYVVIWSKTKLGRCGTVEVVNKLLAVEVLEEVQPDDPMTPGSLAVVAGKQFIRCDGSDPGWRQVSNGEWFYWEDLLAMGQVAVGEEDPAWPEGVA